MMDRFSWYEGEMQIGEKMCDFCKFFDKSLDRCEKFAEIPYKVLEKQEKCLSFKSKNEHIPW